MGSRALGGTHGTADMVGHAVGLFLRPDTSSIAPFSSLCISRKNDAPKNLAKFDVCKVTRPKK
jgi:hypothetical protein